MDSVVDKTSIGRKRVSEENADDYRLDVICATNDADIKR